MHQEVWFQKYQILNLLSSGGTATVYLAEHIKLKSYRAIKFISKTSPLYDLQRNEAFILKGLKHSCIPIIYDIEEDENGSYIVEEYLDGKTLKEYVSAAGSIREESIIRYGLQLCDLILYLHSADRPIIYVDLKPENIILSADELKLIDFGSALYKDELATKRNYMGTKGYAAPELYRRNEIDERCDVYGIGMLLYYMATGLVYSESDHRIKHIDISGRCSGKLKSVINQCLRYNPSQRYLSVNSLKKQLSALIRKNHFQMESGQGLIIAVAGAQNRIGVTHLCFMLCNYLIEQRLDCIYQELNPSGCIKAIKQCYELEDSEEEQFILEGIPMLAYSELKEEGPGKGIRLLDYGCITGENLEDYLQADIKLLVLGAKDWELSRSGEALTMVAEYKDISYLFNFTDGRQFQQIMKSMDHRAGYRIPYVPNPFAPLSLKNGLELFRELIPQMRRKSFRERLSAIVKRGGIHKAKTDPF